MYFADDEDFREEVEFEQSVKLAIISIKKDNLRNKLHRLETPKEKKNYVFIGIAFSKVKKQNWHSAEFLLERYLTITAG